MPKSDPISMIASLCDAIKRLERAIEYRDPGLTQDCREIRERVERAVLDDA